VGVLVTSKKFFRFNVKLRMDEKSVFNFYNKKSCLYLVIIKTLVNLAKRNTNKEIVCIKNYQPFLYICILALVLQIYPKFLIENLLVENHERL
jgi:hypothetical protein